MSDAADGQATAALFHTPLYDLHKEQSARMVPFSGWEMPVQYQGIRAEHEAVRQTAGMFDISHMGKFRLQGAAVIDQLQTLVPTDLSNLKPGAAQYTVLLNEKGGVIDDLIIYLQSPSEEGQERVVLIVNAATTVKDRDWLMSHLTGVQFEDVSTEQALIAVQGPKAIATLQTLIPADSGEAPLETISRFGHRTVQILGGTAFVARTGYTGEDGVEIMLDPSVAVKLWRSLLSAGVIPCGLGARDTLRLEAAMALYGQDVNDDITPLQARLGWLVHLDRKGDFMGRSVLEQQKQNGVPNKLVGLKMQGRGIARHDYPIVHEGKEVGIVTSGTQSPTLGEAIALAYVPPTLAKTGQSLEVVIRGKSYPVEVVKLPFYKRG
ncbi:MAG: glycine cleavage system aminomethyltransferase GcvT [Cyanothece sp. SIO2G6]|nr:glycine cleavage system aminomethyltransferase GcvT [Cyanothece sp. SIO2G6]